LHLPSEWDEEQAKPGGTGDSQLVESGFHISPPLNLRGARLPERAYRQAPGFVMARIGLKM
jgi:hypothetical protein